MLRTSGLLALALSSLMLAAPAVAAPQFGGTNTAPGTGSDFNVDCSDQQYRYMPYCQQLNAQSLKTPAPSTLTTTRTNELACPSGDLVFAGMDRSGNRLYRCSGTSGRAMKFTN